MAAEITIARENSVNPINGISKRNVLSKRTRIWGGYSNEDSVNLRTQALLRRYAYGAVPGRSSENRRRILMANENMIRRINNI